MTIKLGAVGLGGMVTPPELDRAYALQQNGDIDVELVAGSDINYVERVRFTSKYDESVHEQLETDWEQLLEENPDLTELSDEEWDNVTAESAFLRSMMQDEAATAADALNAWKGSEQTNSEYRWDLLPDEVVSFYNDAVESTTFEDYRDMIDTMAATAKEDDELAVMISTPHTLHKEMVDYALDHDAHVLIEKPSITNDGEGDWNGIELGVETLQQARDRGLVLHTGFQRRFNPAYQFINEKMDEIGDIESIEASITQRDWLWCFIDAWRTDRRLSGGGELYDTGQHLIDLVNYLPDGSPTSVEANKVDMLDNGDGNDLPPYEENGMARDGIDYFADFDVEYTRNGEEDEFTAHIVVNGHDPTKDWSVEDDDHNYSLSPHQYLRIDGSEGYIELDMREDTTHLTVNDESYDEIMDGLPFLGGIKMEEFLTAIESQQNGEPYESEAATGDDGLIAVAVTEAVYKSAETGEPIDIHQALKDAGYDGEYVT